jgi:ribosomal protein S18
MLLWSIFTTVVHAILYISFVLFLLKFVFPEQRYYGDINTTKTTTTTSSSSITTTTTTTNSEKNELREKRKKIKAEILSTEETYVTNLNILLNYFARPIKERNILNSKTYSGIFPSEIETITKLNTTFLETLRPIILKEDHSSSQSEKIADVLKKYAHLFKIYIGYIGNYSNAVTLLKDELTTNKKLQGFLQEQKNALKEKGERIVNLQDYLIIPVQRLPRYRLLFEDLLKKTETDHVAYEKLKNAVELIREVISTVNEKEGELKNAVIMADLHKSIRIPVPDFIIPTRKLVEHFVEEDMQIVLQDNRREACSLYVFSDLLLCCYAKKSTLYKKTKALVQYIGEQYVTDKGRVDQVKITPIDANNQHEIIIETTYGLGPTVDLYMKSNGQNIIHEKMHFICKTAELRDKVKDCVQEVSKLM